jgi:PIN domain nuclease of toxin-antitoxin system
VKIIIDTHIFLWLVYDTKKIQKHYWQYLENRDNTLYLSSMSIAEMMIKKSIGNLEIKFDMLAMIEDMGLEILDFDGKSALQLATLPFHHRDPFDRMIISQALTHKYKIISDDSKFRMYSCSLVEK